MFGNAEKFKVNVSKGCVGQCSCDGKGRDGGKCYLEEESVKVEAFNMS